MDAELFEDLFEQQCTGHDDVAATRIEARYSIELGAARGDERVDDRGQLVAREGDVVDRAARLSPVAVHWPSLRLR